MSIATSAVLPKRPENPLPATRGATALRPGLKDVTTASRKLPSRILLHAVQKWGKTSFAAQAPKPIFLCTRGEDGLETLIDSGDVQPTAHFPGTFQTFNHLIGALQELIVEQHDHRTVVVDTVNGAQQLAVESLVGGKYDNDFEKFDAWGRGGQRLLPLFVELTSTLDRLRELGRSIILLAHATVKTWKNPQGLDFPRWEPPLYKEIQEHFDRWADAILFGDLETYTKAPDPKAAKGKGSGGEHRILRCQPHACYNAGNRLGLPAEIDGGDSPAAAWSNFIDALKNRKQ